MGKRIGFSNPKGYAKDLNPEPPKKKPSNTGVNCPLCGTSLNIAEPIYYIDHGDGEVSKDSNFEWDCPNGCEFDNDMILKIDATIERLACIGSLQPGKNNICGG